MADGAIRGIDAPGEYEWDDQQQAVTLQRKASSLAGGGYEEVAKAPDAIVGQREVNDDPDEDEAHVKKNDAARDYRPYQLERDIGRGENEECAGRQRQISDDPTYHCLCSGEER